MLELLAGLGGLVGGTLASEMAHRGLIKVERELTARLVRHYQHNQDLLRAPRRAHCSTCLEILENAKDDLEKKLAGYSSAKYTGRFSEYLSAKRYFEGVIRDCSTETGFKQQLAGGPAERWAQLIGNNMRLVEDALATLSEAASSSEAIAPFADAAAIEIAAAGWPDDAAAIADMLQPTCREQYAECFAKAIAEEIKTDQKFAQLWFALRLEEARRSAVKAATFAEAVHRTLAGGPKLLVPGEANSLFHYTSPVVDTIGREKEKEQLRSFLTGGQGFRWMQLAGVGGQGKSRLALQLVIQAANDKWAAGFLYDEELKAFTKTAGAWQPDRPHLIVLDYIIGRERSISRLMRAFWENREKYQHPVRLLLLERQRWDAGNTAKPQETPKMAALPAPNRSSSPIRSAVEELTAAPQAQTRAPEAGRGAAEWFVKACGAADEYVRNVLQMAYLPSVIELDGMRDTELVWIVRRVAQLSGRAHLPQTDRFISDQLDRLDSAGRPLFAYLLGLAFSTSEEGGAWADREDLLNYVLRREQRQRWSAYFEGEPPAIGDDIPAMRLAVLATIVRGFDFRERMLAELVHPINSDLRRQALALNAGQIAASEQGPGNYLHPLEPDLLGEWFVLKAFDGGLPMDEVLRFAWRMNPTETGAFLQRIAQDFSDHPVAIGAINYAVGDQAPGHLEEFAVQLLRTLPPGAAPLDGALAKSVRQLADRGNADAEVAMAARLMAETGDAPELKDTLLKYVESAVAKRNGAALSLYGYLHFTGRFVRQDNARAATLFAEGANAGSVAAMRNYAAVLKHGVGVEKDQQLAAYWANEAANREDRDAMFQLGEMYLDGEGLPKDLGKAIKWLMRGADAGHKDAAERLAELRIAHILYFGHDLIDSTAREWATSQSARLIEQPVFAQAPLLRGEWRVLPADEAMHFLAEIATSAYDQNLMSELLRLECQAVRSTTLTCFADCSLLEVQVRRNLDSNPCSFFALQGPRGAVVLDGTNSAVYQFARYAFAPSSPADVSVYVRFFFGTMIGMHGRFYIIEKAEHIPWIDAAKTTAEGKSQMDEVAKLVKPLDQAFSDKSEDGSYRADVSILFKDSFFTAKVAIDKRGMVILDEEVLGVEDLKVQIRDYDGIFRYPYDASATGTVRNFRGRRPKAVQTPANAQQIGKKIEFARLALGRPSRPRNAPAESWAEGQVAEYRAVPWIDRPLVNFDWRNVDVAAPEFRSVLEKTHEALANQIERDAVTTMQCTALRVAALPFFRETQLAELQFVSKPDQSRTVIATMAIGPSGASILDSGTIHAINAEILHLEQAEEFSAYLRFFNAHVIADGGPFQIVDGAEDILTYDEEKSRLGTLIRPPKVLDDASSKDSIRLQTAVLYNSHLYSARFRVEKGGMVDMEDSNHLARVSLTKQRYFSGIVRWLGD